MSTDFAFRSFINQGAWDSSIRTFSFLSRENSGVSSVNWSSLGRSETQDEIQIRCCECGYCCLLVSGWLGFLLGHLMASTYIYIYIGEISACLLGTGKEVR